MQFIIGLKLEVKFANLTMKIVIADDHEEILTMMKIALSKMGYEVVTDATGEMVKNMDHSRTGLVILDINLGKNDGREICEMLKTNQLTKDIPVIFASANANLQDTSLDYGADDFLQKPFALSDLLSMVKKYVQAA
jgi:DNA-binding response OmpR family regulator